MKNYKVDIVIPVYSYAEMTKRCIDSVLKTTDEDIHIILIDDCSPGNEIVNLFNDYRNVERISLYKMSFNQGFISSTRIGAKIGKAPYILFLNSDTEAVENNWVNKLIPKEENTVIVGTKLLFPLTHPRILANKIQHAGVAVSDNGKDRYGVFHIFMGYDPDASEVNQIRDINTVTGACFLVRRNIWDKLGGWDDAFGKGVYEDVDFCWRVSQRGYNIQYNPMTYLYHSESIGAIGLENKLKHPLHQYGIENFQVLLKKWYKMVPLNGDSFYGKGTIERWKQYSNIIIESVEEINRKDLDNADKHAMECINLAPELTGGYYVKSLLLSISDQHKEASEYIKIALDKNPVFWEARFQLIKELALAYQNNDANQELELMKEIFPNDKKIKELEWLVLGKF